MEEKQPTDLRVDAPIDFVGIDPYLAKDISDTVFFAASHPDTGKELLKDFISKLHYCLTWGKGPMNNPTKVVVRKDFVPHSYIFYIWNYSLHHYHGDIWYELHDKPFVLALIYDESRKCWGTHS